MSVTCFLLFGYKTMTGKEWFLHGKSLHMVILMHERMSLYTVFGFR